MIDDVSKMEGAFTIPDAAKRLGITHAQASTLCRRAYKRRLLVKVARGLYAASHFTKLQGDDVALQLASLREAVSDLAEAVAAMKERLPARSRRVKRKPG